MVQLSTKEGVLSSAQTKARTRAVRAATAFRTYRQEAISAAVSDTAASSAPVERTSIWPVTAAEMRAERRSRSNSVAAPASCINRSSLAHSASRNVAMLNCSTRGGTATMNAPYLVGFRLHWPIATIALARASHKTPEQFSRYAKYSGTEVAAVRRRTRYEAKVVGSALSVLNSPTLPICSHYCPVKSRTKSTA